MKTTVLASKMTLAALGRGAALAALCLAMPLAVAKLPAPNPTPEAKAKAQEAAAKTAWTNKVTTFQLCKAQDRVAEKYRASATAAGKQPPAPMATPACADPGPFAYTPEAKPLEASGAHSPAPTANAPPSTPVPAAAAQPKKQ